MPTYDYKCSNCSNTQEYKHKINEVFVVKCEDCFAKGHQSQMKKTVTSTLGVHFKGPGFYETDYKGKK